MWEVDHKEGWASKNWCFQTLVLEKTLENTLDRKGIKPVTPKGNRYWIFTGRIDAEAEAPILWPPDAKSQLTGKDPDAGKDLRQEEKGMIEDEMDGWPQGTWVWASSRRSWRTGKPGRLQSFGSQRVKHDWTTTTNKNWGPIVISLHLGTKGWCAIDKWRWKLLKEGNHVWGMFGLKMTSTRWARGCW